MAQVHAEGQGGYPGQCRAGFNPEFAHYGEDGKGHHEHVNAGEVPQNLQLGILAGEMLLRFQKAEEGNGKSGQEQGERDGQCLFPVPVQGILHQIMGKDHVPHEAREVVKHAVRVPVADAQNPHIAVIALIPQRRSQHLDVRQDHAEYPDSQKNLHVLPFGLGQPRAHDGHEEVQAYEHVHVPEGSGIIIEIENKGVQLIDRGAPGVSVHHDVGAGRLHARGKVEEVKQGKRQGPHDQRNQNPLEPA